MERLIKIKEKINLEEIIFILKFNWAAILAFVTFWSYGFFGALTSRDFGLTANILISLIIGGIFVLFLWIWKNDVLYNDKIVLKVKDILVFVLFLAVLLFLSFTNLTTSIGGDQLAHSQQSKLHSITLIEFLSGKTDFLNNFSFKWLMFGADLLMIFIALLLYRLLSNKSWLVKIVIFLFLFLTFRLSIMILGGSGGPHPTFRLFPLWFSSAILTSSDFSFRFSQFLGLVGFLWLTQRILNRKMNFLNSWLFALSVGTIPVLWHTGTLVEQSIWTAISWTLMLLYFFEVDDFNYIRWISIISISSMLRQSAFVAFIPIFLFLVVDLLRKKEFAVKKIFLSMSPILTMFPFFLNGVINGTPSTYAWEQSVLQKIWFALSSGTVLSAIINSVGWYWILLIIPWLFIIKKDYLKIIATAIFFIAAVFVFYSINPNLWGLGRYQSEYAVPFVILGLFILISYMVKYKIISRFLPILLVAMAVYNVYIFKNLTDFNKNADNLKSGFFAILSELPYERKKAFSEARRAGYAGQTFAVGVNYGVFSEILNGFTVSEIREEKGIYNEIKSGISAERINNNKKIKLVLIADFQDSEMLKNDLEKLGWKNWKEFKNNKYNSTIFGLIKNGI